MTDEQHDYSKTLEGIDSKKPIGIFLFNIGKGWQNRYIGNAEFENTKEEMVKNYGDNLIVLTDSSMDNLKEFSKQFNTKFGQQKPEVHFLADHHQGTYKDTEFASFLSSIEASNKRAIILSCGPASKEYHLKGFDYVAIPRPDGNILGISIPKIFPSGKFIMSYSDTISTMRETSNPEVMQKKMDDISKNWFQYLDDYTWNLFFNYATDLNFKKTRVDEPYKPPLVATYDNGTYHNELAQIIKNASGCGITGGHNTDCVNKTPQSINAKTLNFQITH